MGIIIWSLIGLGVLLLGTWQTVSVLQEVRRAMASRAWPTCAGTVRIGDEEPASAAHPGATAVRVVGRRHIIYRYQVGHASLENTRIAFDNYFRIKELPDLNDANPGGRYRTGQEITVYYNPENPSLSCLEPGFVPDMIHGLVIGWVPMILGAAILYAMGWQPF
jgi:hypothetical protein